MYDQLGCGKSFVEGHDELWNQDTWMEELEALMEYLNIESCHLLGQSWGGMLAIAYAILSSTLSSASLWAKEQHRMISFMSDDEQRAILSEDYESDQYQLANEH